MKQSKKLNNKKLYTYFLIGIPTGALLAFVIKLSIVPLFYKNIEADVISTLIAGLMGLFGSILGGLFTMWGVNRTLRVQNKEKFKDSFASKILNLDLLIDELEKFRNEEGEYRLLQKNLYNAHLEDKPKINDSIFINLINSSIKIDGEVYKKIRKFIENYLNIYEDAILIFAENVIMEDLIPDLKTKSPELLKEGKEEIDNIIDNLVEEINDLINQLLEHKKKIEDEYFNY